jgi:hypothetical protein
VTEPAQGDLHTIQPPPSDDKLNQRIAEILVTAATIYIAAKLIEKLLRPFGISADAILAAVKISKTTSPKQRAFYQRHGIDPKAPEASLVRQTANEDLYYRAAYVVAASHRLQKQMNANDETTPSPIELAAESLNYRRHLAARKTRLQAAMKTTRAAQLFGPILGWYLNLMLNNERECIAANGNNFRIDEIPAIGIPGNVHVGCVPGSTLVGASAGHSAMKRWHVGDLVEIRTQSGYVLTATPNHPVLTPNGWLPLGQIESGLNVVIQVDGQRFALSDPSDDNQTTTIAERFEAIRVSSSMVPVRVKMTPEDFHGESVGGEIDIVGADCNLWNESKGLHEGPQNNFVTATSRRNSMPRLSTFKQLIRRVFDSAYSVMRRFGIRLSLLRCHSTGADSLLLSDRTSTDTVFQKNSRDDVSAYVVPSRETLDTLAGAVSNDQIVEVRRYPFSGHVYNLSTNCGCYVANGVVVHNCGCVAGPPHDMPPAMWVDQAVASHVTLGARAPLLKLKRKAS